MKFFYAGLIIALVAGSAFAEDYPRRDMLVEAAEAAKNKELTILDARPRDKYDAGHIPGAVWVDHAQWSKAFGTNQNSSEWGERIGALGIKPTTNVLVYDDALQKDAARVWWILRYFGVKDVRLLNGGWSAWTAAKLPSSKETPNVSMFVFKPKLERNRLGDKDSVLGIVKDKSAQIVDARSEKEHCGETALSKKAGAIPGAIHLEWSDALDKTTQKFKTPEQLKALLKQVGIDVTRSTVTHCQSGGRAAVMAFTLELMGANSVANYYRGWSEWGNLEESPVVTPKTK